MLAGSNTPKLVLTYEYDARRFLPCHSEQVPHSGSRDTGKHFYKLCTISAVEWHSAFASHCFSKIRLSSAWRTFQHNSLDQTNTRSVNTIHTKCAENEFFCQWHKLGVFTGAPLKEAQKLFTGSKNEAANVQGSAVNGALPD